MRAKDLLVSIALVAFLAAAAAIAEGPSPRYVINCGHLQSAGHAAFGAAGTRFEPRLHCPVGAKGA